MNKITFKNYYLLLIALFFLVINNLTAQISFCVVQDGVSASGSVIFGQSRVVLVCDNNVIESHNLIIQ